NQPATRTVHKAPRRVGASIHGIPTARECGSPRGGDYAHHFRFVFLPRQHDRDSCFVVRYGCGVNECTEHAKTRIVRATCTRVRCLTITGQSSAAHAETPSRTSLILNQRKGRCCRNGYWIS